MQCHSCCSPADPPPPRVQDNSRSIAIKALAKANNLELDTVLVDLTNPSIEHLKVNPLGKIPTFVAQDGFVVSECIALAIYCTSTALALQLFVCFFCFSFFEF